MILQTTAYTRFERFAERLQSAVNTVLTESEHDGFGVVHRAGLRYIDVVAQVLARAFGSTCGEAFMEYGTRSSILDDTSCTSRAEARRWFSGHPGTMIVRIVQNDQAIRSLPISWRLRRSTRQGRDRANYSP